MDPPKSSFTASDRDSDEVAPSWLSGRSPVSIWGFHIGLFGALLIAAFVAMRLISLPPTNVTVIWFPAGIALLALHRRFAWSTVITIALAQWTIIALANNYPLTSFRPWSWLMAAANTAGPVLGAWFWRRWVPAMPFASNWAFLKFVLGVAILPALLTAWIIPTVILLAGYLPDLTLGGYLIRVGSITLSSVLGVCLFIPLAIAPWSGGILQTRHGLWICNALNVIVAAVIVLIGFHLTPLGLYLAIPYAMISAIACGPRGLGWGLLVFSVYGLLATTRGVGPMAEPGKDPVSSLFEVAGAVICLGVPSCFAGLTLTELRRHKRNLESTVSTRTRELSESDERYRFAMEAVSEGLFDWQEGPALSFFNPAIRRKMGTAIQDDQVNWIRVVRLMHPDDRRGFSTQVREFLRGSADLFRLEGRLRDPSGRWVWFRARGKVIVRDERGRARRVVGTFSDIDVEKRRLIELMAARDEADHRGREKDTFLANMSHEIRTPMHAMLGFTRVLDATDLDLKQRECVDAILSSGDLLLELLNDLLDLSRIEAGAIKLDATTGNLPEALRQSFKLFESSAQQKGLALSLTIADDLPPELSFDRLRVHQIVANLLSNAIKFTDDGKVTMTVRAAAVASTAPITTWRVSIEISDTGIGISEDQITRLFNPFVQADSSITRRFGGTGLGLAISQRLCELMGGTISVTSKAEHGSAFTAVFMASVPTEATARPAPSDQPPPGPTLATGPLRVLVVEDNRLNRRLAAMMLQKLGHEPAFAENGIEALAQLSGATFDVILMDLQMPELDGFETTRSIRRQEAADSNRPHIPILALTANAESAERLRCLAAGMDDFLTKPLDPETLRNALNRACINHPSSRI